MTDQPTHLFRYRPLDANFSVRELDALENAYLWSPRFGQMNDPMEAFYELGGASDWAIDAMLSPSGKSTADLYRIAQEIVDQFCLVSFSSSHMDLPLWAYYGSSFSGICLEFETSEIFVGDFQNERLVPVTYATDPLPPIALHELTEQGAFEARISRKRVEWRHEQEWRILTGATGAKYYADHALRRIYLGPRIAEEYRERICTIFSNRPTEVLQGHIAGFTLRFETVKPALPYASCDRVGEGRFDEDEAVYDKRALAAFLNKPLEEMYEIARSSAALPNGHMVFGVDRSTNDKNLVYVQTLYRLRSGREVFFKRYFDADLRPVIQT